MDKNLFNKVKSIHGNLSINVNPNGDVEISQNRSGKISTIILAADEIVKLGRCLFGKYKTLAPSPITNKSNTDIQSQRIKTQECNAYNRWTEEDDEDLHKLYNSGLTTELLAEHFKRRKGAIESRLKKLGLK